MTESQFTGKLRRELAKLGAVSVKLHGGSFQRGLPDLLIAKKGKMGLVEVKLGKRGLTPAQRRNLEKLQPSVCIRVDLDHRFISVEGFGTYTMSMSFEGDKPSMAYCAAVCLYSVFFVEHPEGAFVFSFDVPSDA